MDKQELINKLQPFIEKCKADGYPIDSYELLEAYPGVASTSFIIRIKSSWYEGMNCSPVLTVYIDRLWETVDVATRKFIFAFDIIEYNRAA